MMLLKLIEKNSRKRIYSNNKNYNMFEPQRYKYVKPSKGERLKEIICTLFTPTFWKWRINLWAYQVINMASDRRYITVGKNTNIHPTTIIRYGKNVKIGDNCLINHNNLLQPGKGPNGRIIIGNYVHTGVNVLFMAFNHGFYTTEIPPPIHTSSSTTIGASI